MTAELTARYFFVLAPILVVKDRDAPRVKTILTQLEKIPLRVWKRLIAAGLLGIEVTNRPLTQMDDMGHLAGVPQPGHDPEDTYDFSSGTYEPEKRLLLIGNGGPQPPKFATHEVGHAIGMLLPEEGHCFDSTPEMTAHHARLKPKLEPFFARSQRELFAEAVAERYTNGRRAAIRRFDRPLIEWIEEVLA